MASRRAITDRAQRYAWILQILAQSDQSVNAAYKQAIDSNRKEVHYRQVLLACAISKTDDEGTFTPKDVVQPLSGLRLCRMLFLPVELSDCLHAARLGNRVGHAIASMHGVEQRPVLDLELLGRRGLERGCI
jgi:hypothetical protein